MNEFTLAELFGGVARFRALRSKFAEPDRRELAAEGGIDPGNVAQLLKRTGLLARFEQSKAAPVSEAE